MRILNQIIWLSVLFTIFLVASPCLTNATDEILSVQGVPIAPTRTYTSTDVAQNLPDSIINRGDNRQPSAILITCETANIRWTVGGNVPTQAGRGHILYDQQSLRIADWEWIRTFSYISAAAGTPATLQITAEFNNRMAPTN